MRLDVVPYFKSGSGPRFMLVGQDPTVVKKQQRVKVALMLDLPNSRLAVWLRSLLSEELLRTSVVYATNAVKCTFERPPSRQAHGAYKFLMPYFANCASYLRQEVRQFRPDVVISLGEPAHRMIRSLLDEPTSVRERMKDAFTGSFARVNIEGHSFEYSPCLHIQTFRVAATYGDQVRAFRKELQDRQDANRRPESRS
jgi:uracil-DNA glycosylase